MTHEQVGVIMLDWATRDPRTKIRIKRSVETLKGIDTGPPGSRSRKTMDCLHFGPGVRKGHCPDSGRSVSWMVGRTSSDTR